MSKGNIYVRDIKEIIMEALNKPVSRYKGVPVNIFGLPALGSYKKKTIYNTLSKLKNNGYIEKVNGQYIVTRSGKNIQFVKSQLKIFISKYSKDAPKNQIVMYDIPESKKAHREWFRKQLKIYGYVMIQRSVWVGPSPLPRNFMEYIKEIGLKDNLKTFKLAKSHKL